MGRDNQPKERQSRNLARKIQRRNSFDRILIVSEGSKTELLYFGEIRKKCNLPASSITVSGVGAGPLQVVQHAEKLFTDGDKTRRIRPRSFDHIFAVFDRDDHCGYFDALDKAEALDGKLRNDEKQCVPFKAIVSVPCFELWFLLHYEDILAPIHRDDVMRRLKHYIPDYAKGMRNAFAATCSLLDTAMQRAEVLASKFDAYSDPEPFTAVAELVKLLTTLRA